MEKVLRILIYNYPCFLLIQKLPFANECDLSRQQSNDITGQNAVALYQASLNNIGNLMQQQNNIQSIDNEAEVEFVSDDKVEVN